MVRLFEAKRLFSGTVALGVIVLALSACYPPAGPVVPVAEANPTATAGAAQDTEQPQAAANATAPGTSQAASAVTPAAETTAEPVDRWAELLTHNPFSYTLPLPPHAVTPVDGTYTKIDPRTTPHVHCLRCPDYMMEGGLWKLQLDRGVFRIYYAGTGWRSLGSYTLDGERLQLFNDPNCTDAVGTYSWKLESGALVLAAVEDPCGEGLRAANLSDRPWLSCQPPNREAAITDHWNKPEGCDPTS